MMPLMVVLLVSVEEKLFWLSVSGVVISSLLIVGSILFYFSYRYKVIDNQVIVHKGVINKEDISLKFERIQNVNISTPWYFKPFNLVNCILDSAGSSGKEINIPGIDIDYAEKLSLKVHQYNQQGDFTATEEQQADKDSNKIEPTLRISPKEIVKYSLTNGVIIFIAMAMYPFVEKILSKLDLNVKDYIEQLVAYLPIPKFAAIALVFLSLLIFSLTLLMSLSIIFYLVKFYRYEFYHEDNRLRRVTGLLERQQTSIRKQKIQGITVKQNFIARLFNRVTIQVHQTQNNQFNLAAGGKQNFLIPMVKPEQWQDFVRMSFTDFVPEDLKFKGIEKSYLYRNFLFFVLIPIVALSLKLVLTFSFYHLGWLLLLPLGYLICWQKHRRYGVWSNDDFIIIRNGFIGTNYCIFPYYKLQQVSLVQTPIQKKKRLMKISFQLAFMKISIPYLAQNVAEDLANMVLYKTESTIKKWL